MANLVWTTEGLVPREELEMREVFTDNENDCSHAIEYYRDGRLVKRGVSVHIKKGLDAQMELECRS